jgi:hypothetical protein
MSKFNKLSRAEMKNVIGGGPLIVVEGTCSANGSPIGSSFEVYCSHEGTPVGIIRFFDSCNFDAEAVCACQWPIETEAECRVAYS